MISKNFFRLLLSSILCLPIICQAQELSENQDQLIDERIVDSTLTFSIDEALVYAIKKDLDIKSGYINASIEQANKEQTKFNYIPSLNANLNYNIVQGLTLDQGTGRVFQDITRSSNPSISASIILYEGNKKGLLREKADIRTNSALLQVENQKINTQINVIQSYLAALAAQEDEKVILERIALVEKQLDRSEKRVEAGIGNLVDVYNIKSSLANEQRSLVEAQNTIQSQKILLIQFLQLKGVNNIKLTPLEELLDPEKIEIPQYSQVINKSMMYSPLLKSSQLSKDEAINGVALAKADRLPTLRANAGVGTRYSSNIPRDTESQLSDNRSEFFGLTLSIPIFNQLNVRNNIALNKLNVKNTMIDKSKAEQQLTNTVQTAYFNTVAAKSNYLASKVSLISLEESFNFTEKAYEQGATDFISYFESLNNKSRGEISLIKARYTFALRMRILAVLMGDSTAQ